MAQVRQPGQNNIAGSPRPIDCVHVDLQQQHDNDINQKNASHTLFDGDSGKIKDELFNNIADTEIVFLSLQNIPLFGQNICVSIHPNSRRKIH